MNRAPILFLLSLFCCGLYSQSDYSPGNFVTEPPPERVWVEGAKKITFYQIIDADSLLIQSNYSFTKDCFMLTCSKYFYNEEGKQRSVEWVFTYYNNKIVEHRKIGFSGFKHYYNEDGHVFKTKRWDFKSDTTIACCYQYEGQNIRYLIHPSGDTIKHFSYNDQNQLIRVFNKTEELRRYEYDQHGNLIKEFNSSENYLERTHQYDSLNRLMETKLFIDSKYLFGFHIYKYDKEGRIIEYSELDHKKRVFKILLFQHFDDSKNIEIYYKKRKRKKRKPDELYVTKYEFW